MISTQVNQPQQLGASSLFGGPASDPHGPTTGAVRLPGQAGIDTSALQTHLQSMFPQSHLNDIMSMIHGEENRNDNARQMDMNQQNPLSQIDAPQATANQLPPDTWLGKSPMFGQPIKNGEMVFATQPPQQGRGPIR